jgi:hypothetical protein
MNCLYRANVGAGTTIGTYIRVNLIDITLRYSLNRTFIYTGSASCAIIINNVSHYNCVLKIMGVKLSFIL